MTYLKQAVCVVPDFDAFTECWNHPTKDSTYVESMLTDRGVFYQPVVDDVALGFTLIKNEAFDCCGFCLEKVS